MIHDLSQCSADTIEPTDYEAAERLAAEMQSVTNHPAKVIHLGDDLYTAVSVGSPEHHALSRSVAHR